MEHLIVSAILTINDLDYLLNCPFIFILFDSSRPVFPNFVRSYFSVSPPARDWIASRAREISSSLLK